MGNTTDLRSESKNQKNQTYILNFRPLRTYFEDEAATSTPSVIQQWIAHTYPHLTMNT